MQLERGLAVRKESCMRTRPASKPIANCVVLDLYRYLPMVTCVCRHAYSQDYLENQLTLIVEYRLT